MALVTIQLDTTAKEDLHTLGRIFGNTTVAAAQAAAPEPKAAPKAAAPKAAPKKAEPKVEEPDPVVAAENVEDLVGGAAERDFVALREQAVQAATELVTTGQSAKVRDALGSLRAKRVSDLQDGQLEAFLEALV